MIGQKVAGQTEREKSEAYELATLRDGGVCVRCRQVNYFGVNRDHRQNRRATNTIVENIQLLCGSGTTGCHGWKGANPEKAVAEGWAVPGWVRTALIREWPARRMVHGHLIWVTYDDGGGWVEISEAEAKERMGG